MSPLPQTNVAVAVRLVLPEPGEVRHDFLGMEFLLLKILHCPVDRKNRQWRRGHTVQVGKTEMILKILFWSAVYLGVVWAVARCCAINTITEEREERSRNGLE